MSQTVEGEGRICLVPILDSQPWIRGHQWRCLKQEVAFVRDQNSELSADVLLLIWTLLPMDFSVPPFSHLVNWLLEILAPTPMTQSGLGLGSVFENTCC